MHLDLGGKSQEQEEEEQVEELADNCNIGGQNIPALPTHTVVDMPPGAAPQGRSSAWIHSDFVMLLNDLQDAILMQVCKDMDPV